MIAGIGVVFACALILMVFLRVNYTMLHLSPIVCEMSLEGTSPDVFCETRGEGTWLEGKYLFARVDAEGCLILILSEEVITQWKNTFVELHVLQCVLGDTCDIGIDLDYSKDFLDYMKDADTCGYEISEDYTKVIESPEDNGWYYPLIMPACVKMQMFEGKKCSEIKVKFLEVDENGEIVQRVIYPKDIESSTSLND